MTELLDWTKDNPVRDSMLWKQAALDQLQIFRGFAYRLSDKYGEPAPATVISTHKSKSINLPVVEFTTGDGVKVIARDNFYDVKASVWLPRPLNHDLFGCVKSLDSHDNAPCYFEGFESEWVLGPWHKEADSFSASFNQKGFFTFGETVRWLLKKENYSQIPNSESWKELERRRTSLLGLPCIPTYGSYSITCLFRFFETDTPINPDIDKLRSAFTDRLIKDEKKGPIEYITLDFGCGIPLPKEEWLTAINLVIKERRDDKEVIRLGGSGASVIITGLSENNKALATSLRCNELLKSDKK